MDEIITGFKVCFRFIWRPKWRHPDFCRISCFSGPQSPQIGMNPKVGQIAASLSCCQTSLFNFVSFPQNLIKSAKAVNVKTECLLKSKANDTLFKELLYYIKAFENFLWKCKTYYVNEKVVISTVLDWKHIPNPFIILLLKSASVISLFFFFFLN